MPLSWKIDVDWETLDSGPAEERACFAALGISAHDHWLTEGHDALASRLRQKPLLSAYHLAEWAAWNWWRLRWEPRSTAEEWSQSHRVASIGSGYIWPNLTIFSDGERTALIAKSTAERPQTPFRYIIDFAAVVPSTDFENGLDEFFDKVLNRLDSQHIGPNNFQRIWGSLREERSKPELARLRKLEALLGCEPDESDPRILKQLIAAAQEFNLASIEEIAAEHGYGGKVLAVRQLREIAKQKGYDTSPGSIVRLNSRDGLPHVGDVAAWRLGAAAAKALREQERLDEQAISDKLLTRMSGTSENAVEAQNQGADISFAIDENINTGRTVLRSKWHTGRRFELARLLGDRVITPSGNRLFPATRSYTYRQKMQRSFAAEFLSPFDAVDEMLAGDYSMENQRDVADHFKVSEMTIRTLLVNHNRLEREELDGDFEVAAA
ncbi:MAG: hypothetical protein E5W91_25105 [Mesorhizobium sp.]|nr:MAG: hypothetical protein E5W91_25105 [Mesorhizobium sp.]